MYKHTILFNTDEQASRFLASAKIDMTILSLAQEENPNRNEVHLMSLAPLNEEQIATLGHESLTYRGLLFANYVAVA